MDIVVDLPLHDIYLQSRQITQTDCEYHWQAKLNFWITPLVFYSFPSWPWQCSIMYSVIIWGFQHILATKELNLQRLPVFKFLNTFLVSLNNFLNAHSMKNFFFLGTTHLNFYIIHFKSLLKKIILSSLSFIFSVLFEILIIRSCKWFGFFPNLGHSSIHSMVCCNLFVCSF